MVVGAGPALANTGKGAAQINNAQLTSEQDITLAK
jgi:hypothetical protein